MVDCFKKFANESTYFEVSSKEKQHVESPTLTFCFGPGYKQDVMDKYNLTTLSFHTKTEGIRHSTKTISELYNEVTYHIGSDFYLTIQEQRIGNFNFTEVGTKSFSLEDMATMNLTLDSILTGNGICHRLAISTDKIGFFYLFFQVTIIDQSIPDFLETIITSNQNSYGIIYGLWTEGKVLRIESNFGSKVSPSVRLNMKKTEYLPKTSKCSMNKFYYECLATLLYQQNHTNSCSKACLPYFLKDFSKLNGNLSNLSSICDSFEEQMCRNLELAKVIRKSYEVCQVSCKQSTYEAQIRNMHYNVENPNQANLYLIFSSLNILEEKETLAFGVIQMVGYVGGTLGLFIGFSFYGLFSYPLEKLLLRQNIVSY